MPSTPRSRTIAPWLFAAALASALALGCDRRADDLREWRASDHQGAGNSSAWQAPGAAASPAPTGAEPPATPLVEVVWQAQCALCHGPGGRGDGPQGPLLGAKDLSLAEWQEKTSDEQIAQAIVDGKGRMPKFEGLPPEVVGELVSHIRKMRSPRE